MKKVEYKCNLCNEIKKPIELVALCWGLWDVSQKSGYKIVDNADKSDNHLCLTCVDLVKNYK